MKKEDKIAIGRRLREKRIELHYTQQDMADYLCITVGHYGQIERGTRTLTLECLLALYQKLKIDPTYILTGIKIENNELNHLLNEVPSKKMNEVYDVLYHVVQLSK